ncbi:hypothetical protein S83_023777, partial [Arachis hypogaea]
KKGARNYGPQPKPHPQFHFSPPPNPNVRTANLLRLTSLYVTHPAIVTSRQPPAVVLFVSPPVRTLKSEGTNEVGTGQRQTRGCLSSPSSQRRRTVALAVAAPSISPLPRSSALSN